MLDTGRKFKYDDKNDEFVATGLNESYVLARRLRPDGSKTRFYTRNFAFVATIAKNLRRYSVREVKQMDKAAQLARRLGHATSKAVIQIINSGVMNCPVSATDVRNKDVAKGPSFAGQLGLPSLTPPTGCPNQAGNPTPVSALCSARQGCCLPAPPSKRSLPN
jgi:hypothetical protein